MCSQAEDGGERVCTEAWRGWRRRLAALTEIHSSPPPRSTLQRAVLPSPDTKSRTVATRSLRSARCCRPCRVTVSPGKKVPDSQHTVECCGQCVCWHSTPQYLRAVTRVQRLRDAMRRTMQGCNESIFSSERPLVWGCRRRRTRLQLQGLLRS